MSEVLHVVDFDVAIDYRKFRDAIGIRSKETSHEDNSELGKVRQKAERRGPNFQNHLAQAVEGRLNDLDKYYEGLEKYFPSRVYELLSWVSYNFANGDPNCANYQNWAGFVLEGNMKAFEEARADLVKILDEYKPEKEPIHPELQKLLTEPYRVHFSATRIPKVTYNKNKKVFSLTWPKEGLSGCVGVTPRTVKLT